MTKMFWKRINQDGWNSLIQQIQHMDTSSELLIFKDWTQGYEEDSDSSFKEFIMT